MHSLHSLRRPLALIAGLALAGLVAAPALAHEQRDVNGYAFEVGLIDEPVYVGDKSGLELVVHKGDQAVTDLEKTLKAAVVYGTATRDLALTADDETPGRYTAAFIPTAAGKYTFRITGTLPDGSAVDQSFTSSPTGFNEVQEVSAGQFPVQFPTTAELASQAKAGNDAASQVTIAMGLGAAALVLGIVALGVAVANRSRTR